MFRLVNEMQKTGSSVLPIHYIAEGTSWKLRGRRIKVQTIADLSHSFMQYTIENELAVIQTESLPKSDSHWYENPSPRYPLVVFYETDDQNTSTWLHSVNDSAYGRDILRQKLCNSCLRLIRDIYDILDEMPSCSVLMSLTSLLVDVDNVITKSSIDSTGASSDPQSRTRVPVHASCEEFILLGGVECLLRTFFMIRQENKKRAHTASLFENGCQIKNNSATNDSHILHRNMLNRNDIRSFWDNPFASSNLDPYQQNQDHSNEVCTKYTITSVKVSEWLSEKDGFVAYIFHFLDSDALYQPVFMLLELVFAVRKNPFDLCSVPNFNTLIHSLPSHRFASFCRILGLILVDPRDRQLMENPNKVRSIEWLRLRRRRLLRIKNVIDRNHALIYNSSLTIQRVLLVLKAQCWFTDLAANDSSFGLFLNSTSIMSYYYQDHERDDWEMMESISQRMLSGNHVVGSDLELSDSLSHLRFSSESPDRPLFLKATYLSAFRVDVLFLLSILLSGNRKVDFKQRLISMGFMEIMNIYFDHVDWKSKCFGNGDMIPHESSCKCCQDARVKMQYLQLLLVVCECGMMNADFYGSRYQDSGEKHPRATSCNAKKKKLLCKLIRRFVREPRESVHWAWLSICIQAIMRQASVEEKLFLTRRALPRISRFTTLNASVHYIQTKPSIHHMLDVLGELIKGDWVALPILLSESNDHFKNIVAMVRDNLLQSNLLLRSMYLAAERARNIQASDELLDTLGQCVFIDHFDIDQFHVSMKQVSGYLHVNAASIVYDLVNTVSIEDVSYRNMSCLNTAILILILQHRQGCLVPTLDKIGKKRSDAKVHLKAREPEALNFRKLLWFWEHFYSSHAQDRLNLELSTGISFAEWKDLVSLLCLDDGSDTSLLPSPIIWPIHSEIIVTESLKTFEPRRYV
ncbi:unnamed protein product [Albugo candida]|nr:unnamed protein product [Albugo candida]|eukprot:CCI39546.1 unnamed protein product [Albugo candida]